MKTKRNRRKENLTAKQCERILNEQLEKAKDDPSVIQDIDGNTFALKRGEKIFQCYDRKDKIRRHFPKYLFVTTHKRMLSVQGKDSVKWLKLLDGGEYGRPSYHLSLKGKTKTVAYYNILALVLGTEAYGTARKLLEKEGFMAIGSKGKLQVNGHHIIAYDKKKAMKFIKYDEAIEFVNNVVHQLLHSMPAIDDSDFIKDLEWMYDLSRIASEEEPNKATIALGDEIMVRDGHIVNLNREIQAVNKTTFSEQAVIQYQLMTGWIENMETLKRNGFTEEELERLAAATANPEKYGEVYDEITKEKLARESNNG